MPPTRLPMPLHRACFAGFTRARVVVNNSAVNNSAVNNSAVNKSAVNKSAVNNSAVNESAVNGSAVNGSAVNRSAVNGSAVNDSAVNDSAVNDSVVNNSALATASRDRPRECKPHWRAYRHPPTVHAFRVIGSHGGSGNAVNSHQAKGGEAIAH
ncbi:unnamed protein product [Lampetra planeri]